MQLFIVSNRSNTCYFANNHSQHYSFDADERFLPIYQFAGKDNKKITHLDDFADKFLAKCAVGEMISRYMVLVAGEQKLMIMRPYQIYAVKAIVDCIHQNRGNGYIWHTTGSGKTLTSFKASTLLKDNPDVDKCLFVVDRKDLDRQTREEFNKFQEGCVEEKAGFAYISVITRIEVLGWRSHTAESLAIAQDVLQQFREIYFVRPQLEPLTVVIPANAGIQRVQRQDCDFLDARVRGHDGFKSLV